MILSHHKKWSCLSWARSSGCSSESPSRQSFRRRRIFDADFLADGDFHPFDGRSQAQEVIVEGVAPRQQSSRGFQEKKYQLRRDDPPGEMLPQTIDLIPLVISD